jgi:hypothetical protein
VLLSPYHPASPQPACSPLLLAMDQTPHPPSHTQILSGISNLLAIRIHSGQLAETAD